MYGSIDLLNLVSVIRSFVRTIVPNFQSWVEDRSDFVRGSILFFLSGFCAVFMYFVLFFAELSLLGNFQLLLKTRGN